MQLAELHKPFLQEIVNTMNSTGEYMASLLFVKLGCFFMAAASITAATDTRLPAPLSRDRELLMVRYQNCCQQMHWSNGGVVGFDKDLTVSPVLITYDERGKALIPFALTIPGASSISVLGVDRAPDGKLGMCGAAIDSGGRLSPFLALVPPSPGAEIRIIRTAPYTPYRLAFAPDGTVWTSGLEQVDGKEVTVSEQKGVIRHFDTEGKEIGAFLPRSEVQDQAMIMSGYLAAARDRVGWYSAPRIGSGSQIFVEVSNTGAVTKFVSPLLAAHERVSGLAVTDDGGSYITTLQKSDWKLYRANAETHAWTELSPPDDLLGVHAAIYGGDGNALVFKTRDRFTLEIYRSR